MMMDIPRFALFTRSSDLRGDNLDADQGSNGESYSHSPEYPR